MPQIHESQATLLRAGLPPRAAVEIADIAETACVTCGCAEARP